MAAPRDPGSQAELARQLSMTADNVNAVMRGRRRPSLRLALAIEAITGIPPRILVAADRETCDKMFVKWARRARG